MPGQPLEGEKAKNSLQGGEKNGSSTLTPFDPGVKLGGLYFCLFPNRKVGKT